MFKLIPRFQFHFPSIEFSTFLRLLIKNEIVSGKYIQKFEKEFKKFIGSKNAIAFSSARVGLYVVFKALGLKSGDKVILSAFNTLAILPVFYELKIEPIFIDVEEKTFNIDYRKIEEKIESKTKAILITHIEGLPANIKPILKLAKKHKLKVIEDCAHSIGAQYENKMVGNFGDAAIFSFGPTKCINTLGGGMVVTNDDELAKKILRIRNLLPLPSIFDIGKKIVFGSLLAFLTSKFFFPFVYIAILLTYFFFKKDLGEVFFKEKIRRKLTKNRLVKFSNLQAYIGLKELKSVKKYNKKLQNLALIYDKHLKPQIKKQKTIKGCERVYLHYSIKVPNRDAFKKRLLLYGIDTEATLLKSCPETLNKGKAIFSKKLEKEILYLPMSFTLKENDIIYVAKVINKIWK